MKELFLSPYGLCLLGAAVISTAAGCLVFARRKLGWASMLLVTALTFVLGYCGARLYYIVAQNLSAPGFIGDFFSSEPYLYAFCGAALGFMAAAALTALILRRPFGELADAAVIPALLMVILARAAEVTTDFGWGAVVDEGWLLRVPFAVQDNMWGDWHLAVFNLEAVLAAGALMIVLLHGHRRRGTAFATGLMWWSIGQVFCETFRTETVKFGFLPIQQLQCAVFALIVLLVYAVGRRRAGGRFPVWHLAGYIAGCCLVAFFEWAMDKCTWPAWIDSVGMAADLIAMGVLVQHVIDGPHGPADCNKEETA